MRRQTSERLEEISCAILVPLTTTVAFPISRRTISPKRASVCCRVGATVPARAAGRLRIVVLLLMRRLCANRAETTMEPLLGGNHAHAHIHRLRRMSQEAYGNEVHAGLRIGADIFQANPARTLNRDVAFG